jgi:hypothetical protein
MKTLLAYTKEWKVWHKHWGNSMFTVEIPTERSPQAEKTRCIQMIQTHGSIQLSMGAALLERLIDADTTFTLCLLPDVDRKARPPTSTSVREIISLVEINYKKVWICVSTGSNGRTMGYFFQRGARNIQAHCDIYCMPGRSGILVAQALWMYYGGLK